jgi:hypothetical protein
MPGSSPDCNAICQPENLTWTREFSGEEYIVADEAFYSLRAYYDRTIIPDLRSSSTIDNADVSALRSIVEQGWESLQEWVIIRDRWKSNYCRLGDLYAAFYQVISIVMGLNNLYHKPFRGLDLNPSELTGLSYHLPL